MVGGAVRDKLLNLPITDKDWVVVGACVQDMITLGYQQVGRSFPVFLHPITREEYALARTEKKAGSGHTGFVTHATAEVSLVEDLARRDLTLNAMAQEPSGKIIDPFGGQKDIKNRILRHVSPAFCEDPLRILRVARFAARYAHLGFRVADDTLAMMGKIAHDLEALTPERIWHEIDQALGTQSPHVFFHVLRKSDALRYTMPEVEQLFSGPQSPQDHPATNAGTHTLQVLHKASQISSLRSVRFAALVHKLGRTVPPPKHRPPIHPGYDTNAEALLEKLCQRLKVPTKYKKLGIHVSRYSFYCHNIYDVAASDVIHFLDTIRAFHDPENLENFLKVCEANAYATHEFQGQNYPQANSLRRVYRATASISAHQFVKIGYKGKSVGQKIHQKRVETARSILHEANSPFF